MFHGQVARPLFKLVRCFLHPVNGALRIRSANETESRTSNERQIPIHSILFQSVISNAPPAVKLWDQLNEVAVKLGITDNVEIQP